MNAKLDYRNDPRPVLETHLLWDQKVKDGSHESQKHYRRGSLHSCECWILLVANFSIITTTLDYYF